jgi:hypothetical protein
MAGASRASSLAAGTSDDARLAQQNSCSLPQVLLVVQA